MTLFVSIAPYREYGKGLHLEGCLPPDKKLCRGTEKSLEGLRIPTAVPEHPARAPTKNRPCVNFLSFSAFLFVHRILEWEGQASPCMCDSFWQSRPANLSNQSYITLNNNNAWHIVARTTHHGPQRCQPTSTAKTGHVVRCDGTAVEKPHRPDRDAGGCLQSFTTTSTVDAASSSEATPPKTTTTAATTILQRHRNGVVPVIFVYRRIDETDHANGKGSVWQQHHRQHQNGVSAPQAVPGTPHQGSYTQKQRQQFEQPRDLRCRQAFTAHPSQSPKQVVGDAAIAVSYPTGRRSHRLLLPVD